MQSSKEWKRSFLLALLGLLVAFSAAATSTFAWYIYNTNAHTTRIRMAAGTSASLEISKDPKVNYSSSVPLSEFNGRLNPVSTNNILLGFRKVYGFVNTSDTRLVARLFKTAETTDFYCTTLFLRAKGGPLDVYLSNMTFQDSDENNPLSSAIRMGLVVHDAGKVVNTPNEVDLNGTQYIIDINPDKHVQHPDYNTYKGQAGHVLDLTNPDFEATTPFSPLKRPDCFCTYDPDSGQVTLQKTSQKICSLDYEAGNENKFVQVDVYIWLEGCDPDCTGDLVSTADKDSMLKNVAISFAGIKP